MKNKKILIIGGTGIIGNALSAKLIQNNYQVTRIALEDNCFLEETKLGTIIVDRNIPDLYLKKIKQEKIDNISWDAVIDIISFNKKHAIQTLNIFGKLSKKIYFFSTYLINENILEKAKKMLAGRILFNKQNFPYVYGKIEMEEEINNSELKNKTTIIRLSHVIGKGSRLGCLPIHNREVIKIEEKKQKKWILNLGSRLVKFVFSEFF